MIIREASIKDQAKWDDYVARHPSSTPYHLLGWGMAVREAYGHTFHFLLAEDGEHVRGILPCVYIKPPIIRGELVCLPFCDVGGILSDSTDVEQALLSRLLSLGKELGVKHIEVRQDEQGLKTEEVNSPITVQTEKARMILQLPASSDDLMCGFKSKLRSQLRKSANNGLEFRWCGVGDLDTFYAVFSENMKHLGSPVHSRDWFRAVLAFFGEKAKLGMIYFGQTAVGGGIILCHAKSVTIPWASTLRIYNHLSPNMLLYWNFLKYASDHGYSFFDFGRSTPGEGTYKFKEQWGARPSTLKWHYISVSGKTQENKVSFSNKRKIVENIWKRLPLCVANNVGPAVRKYISL